MSFMDDYGNPLDMSNSPGLATLPADVPPVDESAGLAMPPSVSDRSTFADTSQAPPRTASPGFAAAYKASRTSDDQEYLKNLPTLQKVGLLLQSYQAGVEGRPNPFEQVLAQKQKREAEFRAELGTTIQTIKGGVDLVRAMPPGPARDALIEQITRASGANGQLVGEALKSAGTDNEKAITDIVSVIENPRAQAMLVATASKAADPRKEALRLISDSDFMKRLEVRADQDTLPSVTAKLKVVSRAMEKMPQFKGEDGKASFTMADLRDQNAKLPKELQLTDAELGTANRNQAALITYGMKTDKTQQDEQSAGAKRKEEGPHSEIAKLNRDLANGEITKPQWQAGMRKALMANEKQDASKVGGNVIPSQHADLHGKDYLDTLPSGTAATVKGIAEGRIDPKTLSTRGGAREAMLERVTQYDPNFNQATYGARAGVQKDFTSGKTANNVTAINTAIGHLGSAYDLQQALTSNDTRVINQVVNKIKTETGDQSVNNYDTAISAVGNELMRVFRQVGASEVETKQWEEKFKAANSPEQRVGALRTAGELLQSRIDAVNDQWKRGMNTQEGFPNLLSEKSGATMARIRGASGTSSAPQPGTVKGGYRFKGGDPSKQENWERV